MSTQPAAAPARLPTVQSAIARLRDAAESVRREGWVALAADIDDCLDAHSAAAGNAQATGAPA